MTYQRSRRHVDGAADTVEALWQEHGAASGCSCINRGLNSISVVAVAVALGAKLFGVVHSFHVKCGVAAFVPLVLLHNGDRGRRNACSLR